MAVPKRKTSKRRRDMRRSHHAIKEPTHITLCSNPDCRKPVRSHEICPACGFYKGKQVIKIKEKE